MAFNSWSFIVFAGAVVGLYFAMPARRRWRVLLAASYFFYLWASWRAGAFLIFTTVTTYAAARLISQVERQAVEQMALVEDTQQRRQIKVAATKRKRLYLALDLLANFGLLFAIKYLNATIGVLNSLSGSQIPGLNLLLPLGISFYMFQSAGYLIDVYRGQVVADTSLPRFALFVAYFPQIIQGPISRYNQLADQLYQSHSWDTSRARDGVQLMLWGYFKKVAIADVLGLGVSQVFANYGEYGGLFIFGAAVGYGLQVYCDFSGGIDVARGLSQVLGITLTENFRRPYFAVSISDFWRRWHITLGSWMKDYLFYPLALSKPFARLGRRTRAAFPGHFGKALPTCLATLIVFLIVGAWHGASAKYLVYGLLNGVFIAGGDLLGPAISRRLKALNINENGSGLRVVKILLTFVIVGVSRYFSRAASLSAAWAMLKRTVAVPGLGQLGDGTWATLGWGKLTVLYLAAGLLALFCVGLAQERGHSIRAELNKRGWLIQAAALAVGLSLLLWFGLFSGSYTAAEFIYMKF